MNPKPEMTNVFQFMELRAPFSPEAKSLRQNYVYDDFVGYGDNELPDRIDTDLQSATSPSAIGRLVYEHVFCTEGSGNFEENVENLIKAILGLLIPYRPFCPTTPEHSSDGIRRLSITELERRSYIVEGDLYYLLPERMEQIERLMLFPELQRALDLMERARGNFDISYLTRKLEAIFKERPLREVVFENAVYTENFRAAKRTLFDTLYLLYILRRCTSVNLEHVIDGLRVLHVLEALAIDSLVNAITTGSLCKSDTLLRKTLEVLFPELQGWNGTDPLPTLPLIRTKADFEAYSRATPVIHPIFARLLRYKFPFNDLKPIGIGDLKVVKQWLVAYLPGEISHIENVLKGEIKDRTHRRLEKTEESFSFSSSTKEWTQKDTQATGRFELKGECENIVKTEVNVGANTNLVYNHSPMLQVSAAGNFGYKRDATEQSKTSSSFGHEIVSKAIEQVEKNAMEARSITKLFETEETNKHGFDNKEGPGHVTGIYRWLDKKYKAQLFNFGKRMMFEFMVPEPAAFFVESRLRAYEATVECPQPPEKPVLKTVSLGFNPSDINKEKFQDLRQKYDLAEFTYPMTKKWVELIDSATGKNFYSEHGMDSSTWQSRSYNCKLNSKNYRITRLRVTGYIYFWGRQGLPTDANPAPPNDINTLEIYLGGQNILRRVDNTAERWFFSPGFEVTVSNTTPFESDDVSLLLGFWDIAQFDLSFHAELELSSQTLLDWQTQVYNKVKAIEQQRVDRENQENEITYKSRMSEYHNRLAELKATSINDLLQGQSEGFNREIIRTELKKHCLTLLTKEFDADSSNDLIAKMDPIKGVSEPDNFIYRRFEVDTTNSPTTCSFEVMKEQIDYPSIDLEVAKKKGRYIQFWEQAFEWQQLAYIFYPYFWAQQPDWIQMMSRTDDADPNMTAFLQAGSAKVLLAVTPAYENTVLHFLATREPWEGGPAPVIGDPLFIPLHEELRKRQGDLYNAVPEGEPWPFILPTSLVYLDDSGVKLPEFPDILAE